MILLPTKEDFSQASGLFDGKYFESIYEAFVDTSFVQFARIITLHLRPSIQEDINTQNQAQAQQYNPFFGRVPVPNTNTRGTGAKVTPRDINYKAHVKIGPMKIGPASLGREAEEDLLGIGDLKSNEAMITLGIESLTDLQNTLSISIEGRRYSISERRQIGFSRRKYIMVWLKEIQERDNSTQINDGP